MNTERKLATVQVIEKLSPIESADKIEVCHVLGWECVVKKGEFKVGDKVVYVECDAVMPDVPEFEFLRDRKFRVRTIKLRGQISQGLVLPVNKEMSKMSVGADVTDLLGIKLYQTPSERAERVRVEQSRSKLKKFMMRYSWFRRLFLSRSKKSGWPFWIAKTDEERIQNFPHVIEQFKDEVVYITEKVDFQSCSFTGKMVPKYPWLGKYSPLKYQFVVCSRNLTTNDKNSLYWKIAEKYNIEKILKESPNITIQGEQGDTKVQGNKYGLTEPALWVFNIIDHERKYHYDWVEMVKFCNAYGLTTVPLLAHTRLYNLAIDVKQMIEYSKGESVLAPIPREGVVVRSIINGQKRLSFKCINPDFLLKYSD
jgi:hypothetical protein